MCRWYPPFSGPTSVERCLVPEANRLFFTNVGAMYGGRGNPSTILNGPPHFQAQAELLAARVSALNSAADHHTLGCRASSEQSGKRWPRGCPRQASGEDVAAGGALLRFGEAVRGSDDLPAAERR